MNQVRWESDALGGALRRVALAGIALAVAAGVAGCAKAEAKADAASTSTAAPTVKIAKVISGGISCVAQAGDNSLVYVAADTNATTIKVLPLWQQDSSTAVGDPVYGTKIAASAKGCYMIDLDNGVLGYAPFADPKPRPLSLASGITNVWASPGGRLLIQRQPDSTDSTFAFVDNATTKPAEKPWEPDTLPNEVVWLNDSQMLMQLESDTATPGWGRIALVTLGATGTVDVQDSVVEDGQCPAPDPSGRFWVRANEGSIEVFDARTHKELGVYRIDNAPDVLMLGAPAWCDDVHVAIPAATQPDPSIWILDLSAVLPKS